jgi:large subunit ribosomal protein L13
LKTFIPKKDQIEQKWYVIDAEGQVLGRLAAQVATVLRGKHKPVFTPHLDVGDYVVVVNAEKVRLSGKKFLQKQYFRHSGYPGGETFTSFQRMMDKHPDKVIKLAVKGMLPHNRLGRKLIKKLKVYSGSNHPHEAQKPEALTLPFHT